MDWDRSAYGGQLTGGAEAPWSTPGRGIWVFE